jgi:hypothetical protein
MIIFRAMSDIQDEGGSTDESDRKSEDGAYVWTKKDVDVAHKIGENSSHQQHEHHSRSQSIDSHGSDSSETSSGKSSPSGIRHSGVAVTFGITASDTLTPVDNLSGWKITWLSKTYNKVVGLTGLTRRGDFRVRFISFPISFGQVIDFLVCYQNKFHSQHMPMYVCYPAEDGFGLDGVNKLIKSLRQ